MDGAVGTVNRSSSSKSRHGHGRERKEAGARSKSNPGRSGNRPRRGVDAGFGRNTCFDGFGAYTHSHARVAWRNGGSAPRAKPFSPATPKNTNKVRCCKDPCRRARLLRVRLIDPLLQDARLLRGDGRLDVGRRHAGVLGQVNRVLPREEGQLALGVGLTAKVAVGGGDIVLRLAQLQVSGQGARPAVEVHLNNVGDGGRAQVALLGAVRLDEEGERLGDADGVRELDAGALGEAGLDDRLGHPAACVGGRPVHLGRVLAGEGTAAVRAPATVRIDDDLAAGEARVALRASDDELARRVDVQVARLAVVDRQGRLAVLQLDGLEGGQDDLVVDQLVHLLHRGRQHLGSRVLSAEVGARLLGGALGLERLGVLRRDDHSVDHQRLNGAIGVLLVLDGHLIGRGGNGGRECT
eukprot:scaffold1503_cov120-Isochrysis_galbana.AAC.12